MADFKYQYMVHEYLYGASVKEQTTWITWKLFNVILFNNKKIQCYIQGIMIAAFKSFKHGMFTTLCPNFKMLLEKGIQC